MLVATNSLDQGADNPIELLVGIHHQWCEKHRLVSGHARQCAGAGGGFLEERALLAGGRSQEKQGSGLRFLGIIFYRVDTDACGWIDGVARKILEPAATEEKVPSLCVTQESCEMGWKFVETRADSCFQPIRIDTSPLL